MDTDRIIKLCARLKLSADEGKAVEIEGEVKEAGLKKISLCLVGKLLSAKLTNRNAIDRKRVLMGGPWNFDNAMLVLEVPTGIGKVKDIDVGASGDCFGKFLRLRVAIDIQTIAESITGQDGGDRGRENAYHQIRASS
ncbi:hypothetical protein JRO89_XS05G0200800 [Xanthoceras sorbifolium]|uniref:Uncharacterized protein n=1 Tax=Xanthoceras sorbifolium TaxID=99658 RepID=A0ABQ8I2F4_9ROSI|nr:hypothetical protein JRO89_XS05G0200800 [Xanthoceras sorbifolium]